MRHCDHCGKPDAGRIAIDFDQRRHGGGITYLPRCDLCRKCVIQLRKYVERFCAKQAALH